MSEQPSGSARQSNTTPNLGFNAGLVVGAFTGVFAAYKFTQNSVAANMAVNHCLPNGSAIEAPGESVIKRIGDAGSQLNSGITTAANNFLMSIHESWINAAPPVSIDSDVRMSLIGVKDVVNAGTTSAISSKEDQNDVAGDEALVHAKRRKVDQLTLMERAQADPAGLIGARLKTTWGSKDYKKKKKDQYTCEVRSFRKANGVFELLCQYNTDQVEQWEMLGPEDILLKEPTEVWTMFGSELVGMHIMHKSNTDDPVRSAVITCWLPSTKDHEPALFHSRHEADDDVEDLSFDEATAAIALYKKLHPAPDCSIYD